MEMSAIQPRLATRRPTRGDGLVIAATVGHDTREARLEAIGPLRRALGCGQVVLIDDGTLGGSDRVRLARACGDPQFVIPGSARTRGFPTGADWKLLLTALERRRHAYCVVLGNSDRVEAALPELSRAIASNRSFARLRDGPVPTELEPHLVMLEREGWPYLDAAPEIVGLAAGGDGATAAVSLLPRLERALGIARARAPQTVPIVVNFMLARERNPRLWAP
jgi:hypothetical protein